MVIQVLFVEGQNDIFLQSLTHIFENIYNRKVPAHEIWDHSAKEIVHPKELGSRGGLEEDRRRWRRREAWQVAQVAQAEA